MSTSEAVASEPRRAFNPATPATLLPRSEVPPPHRPTELQRLLLRAATLRGEEARDAWERSRDFASDAARLDHASYRLLPQLYRNLLDAGVDDAQMSTLKGIYRHSWYCNQRLFHEAADVIRALTEAGIETIVLKGAALAVLYYRDPGARPMEDLDVLVPAAEAGRAMEVLREAGWRREAEEVPSETIMRIVHSTGFAHTRGSSIDLHWGRSYEPLPDGEIWRDAVPVTIGGVETRALAPTDALMQICLHGLGYPPAPLRWVSDAVMVTRSAGAQIDWDRLAADGARWRVSAKLETALRLLHDSFDVAIPATALQRLARAPRPLHERLAIRAVTNPGRPGVQSVLFWDRYRRLRAAGAPTPGGFPRFFRESIYKPDWLTVVRAYAERLRPGGDGGDAPTE